MYIVSNFFFLLFIILPFNLEAKQVNNAPQDTLSDFKVLLNTLSDTSNTPLFSLHCKSILQVIDAELILSDNDISQLNKMYRAFTGQNTSWHAGELSSYLQRRRPFIISWISPTDGLVSLAWLVLPENWNPQSEYPLYVSLHGAWEGYQSPLDYMALPLIPETYMEESFEDGYTVLPWGRGNEWYESIGEVDIWECIDVVDNLVKINQNRKYLVGHSMGGYGAWAIAQGSADYWAAIGIYAGALAYKAYQYLNIETAIKLKDIPVYIVCGEQDSFININFFAYRILQDVGNQNISFVSYPGGHQTLLEQWQGMFNWIKNYINDNNTDVNADNKVFPNQLKLYNNYPNPFNPETKISYYIPSLSYVELKVFDVLGREVEILVSKEQNAGYYEVTFNADDLSGGIYMYTLTAGDNSITRKMLLVK